MKIEKLNPEEFGLQKAEATTIEKAFEPKIIERETLAGIYEELIKSELTPELCDEARSLRLKLVKVRTGIADIHRTQKAFFLAAGRFVDAWKNKETEPVTQMEEKLTEIEKHYENLEKERKAKLRTERLAELEKYETDATFVSVEDMNDQVWSSYLDGVKYQYEKRKEAERKEEEERQRKAAAEQKQRSSTTRGLLHLRPTYPIRGNCCMPLVMRGPARCTKESSVSPEVRKPSARLRM